MTKPPVSSNDRASAVETVNPPELPKPGGYSHGAVSGSLVTVAGQLPAEDAKDSDFATQFGSALGAVVSTLEACGTTAANILHLRIFITDLAAYMDARRALAEPFSKHLQGHLPPTTMVEVSGLVGGAQVEIEALAARPVPSWSTNNESRTASSSSETSASLRLRLAPSDARYAGGLVAGSKTMELFADLETEIALREGGDEGLCVAYDMVEFLAPLKVGDFVEATARVVSRGRSSRRIYAEVYKVLTVDERGVDVSPPEPVLAARASATIVVGQGPASTD